QQSRCSVRERVVVYGKALRQLRPESREPSLRVGRKECPTIDAPGLQQQRLDHPFIEATRVRPPRLFASGTMPERAGYRDASTAWRRATFGPRSPHLLPPLRLERSGRGNFERMGSHLVLHDPIASDKPEGP